MEQDKDYKEYMMEKGFSCPVCDKDFKNWVVRKSKVRYIKSDTDLRPYYIPVDPLLYDVAICPHCGYSAMVSDFDSIRYSQAERIKKEITPKFVPKEYPMIYTPLIAIERYKIALLSTYAKKGKNSEKAYICLKIAWLYREEKITDKELYFLENAFEMFELSFQQEEFPIFGMDEPTIYYLLGELARRLGKYDKSKMFLGRVISSPGLTSRLRDRTSEVRELLKKDTGELDKE